MQIIKKYHQEEEQSNYAAPFLASDEGLTRLDPPANVSNNIGQEVTVKDVGFDDDVYSNNNNSEVESNVESGQNNDDGSNDNDNDKEEQTVGNFEGNETLLEDSDEETSEDSDKETLEDSHYLTCINCKREQ
eukprot:11246743-Ditylum_brightwellii.AAC.1